jgi:hypothetical protein
MVVLVDQEVDQEEVNLVLVLVVLELLIKDMLVEMGMELPLDTVAAVVVVLLRLVHQPQTLMGVMVGQD